jgi:serine/threonine protein kinase
VTSIDARLPTGFDEIIQRCLRKDPAGRYSSAALILADLNRLTSAPQVVATHSAPANKTVVVIPFVNRSSDPDNEYFSDGLTEEVIADLSCVAGFRTISRNSAMKDLKVRWEVIVAWESDQDYASSR